nr:MAG TPA: hypothetical protein [Caudoviricetes sp.]
MDSIILHFKHRCIYRPQHSSLKDFIIRQKSALDALCSHPDNRSGIFHCIHMHPEMVGMPQMGRQICSNCLINQRKIMGAAVRQINVDRITVRMLYNLSGSHAGKKIDHPGQKCRGYRRWFSHSSQDRCSAGFQIYGCINIDAQHPFPGCHSPRRCFCFHLFCNVNLHLPLPFMFFLQRCLDCFKFGAQI